MRIDNLGFKTLSEWLKIFPPRTDITIKIFGQTCFWRNQERLLESLPPELLKSYVCNLGDDFGYDVCLDVACYELEPCNDEKDEIITDLWEQLYLTADNSKRMGRIFEEYKAEYEFGE
jgi:hypothetical protein